MLGPGVDAGVAIEAADDDTDADLAVRTEDVFAMLGGVDPGAEDRTNAAEVA